MLRVRLCTFSVLVLGALWMSILAAPAALAGPDQQRADACDRILGRLEAGQGRQAAELFGQYVELGLFAALAGDGSAFLAELVDSAEQLEAARSERHTSTSPAAAPGSAAASEAPITTLH